jgi:hypothetical protein
VSQSETIPAKTKSGNQSGTVQTDESWANAGMPDRGNSTMPSEYFRRQADICTRLSPIASDEVVSTILIAMAQDYAARADTLEAKAKSLPAAIIVQNASPDRETSGP